MAGGPTRTSWLCHGERRPSRLGVNISRKEQSRGVNTSLKGTTTVAQKLQHKKSRCINPQSLLLVDKNK